MILRSILTGAVSLLCAAAALADDTGSKAEQAAKHRHAATQATSPDCCEPYRFAYAESWYGNKKVVAPVRHTPVGDEVLLPNDIWVSCEFSCEYILRKQTLHFWQDQGSGSGNQFAPAYPRGDTYVDSWGQRHGYLF